MQSTHVEAHTCGHDDTEPPRLFCVRTKYIQLETNARKSRPAHTPASSTCFVGWAVRRPLARPHTTASRQTSHHGFTPRLHTTPSRRGTLTRVVPGGRSRQPRALLPLPHRSTQRRAEGGAEARPRRAPRSRGKPLRPHPPPSRPRRAVPIIQDPLSSYTHMEVRRPFPCLPPPCHAITGLGRMPHMLSRPRPSGPLNTAHFGGVGGGGSTARSITRPRRRRPPRQAHR